MPAVHRTDQPGFYVVFRTPNTSPLTKPFSFKDKSIPLGRYDTKEEAEKFVNINRYWGLDVMVKEVKAKNTVNSTTS